jgi:DNA-directed RNA polymerase specialized sigma24 family protein
LAIQIWWLGAAVFDPACRKIFDVLEGLVSWWIPPKNPFTLPAHDDAVEDMRLCGIDVAEQLLLDAREIARLTRLARLQFGIGADDVLDLLQETALDVVREPAGIRHPRAYVTRVFYIQCCQFVRRAVRRRTRLSDAAMPDVAAPGGAATEDLLALRQALGRISPGCRGLLMAHYMEGKGFGEAAREFGFSDKQAWKRFNACLRKLRSALEKGTK